MRTTTSRHWWGRRVQYDFTAEIDNGVALLDAKVPGWEQGINTDRLAIISGSRCVLGQVARNQWGVQCANTSQSPFGVGVNKLRLRLPAETYGFYLPHGVARQYHPLAWRQLTRQWKARIEALQLERAAKREDYSLAR